jgi:hypothetical protein
MADIVLDHLQPTVASHRDDRTQPVTPRDGESLRSSICHDVRVIHVHAGIAVHTRRRSRLSVGVAACP